VTRSLYRKLPANRQLDSAYYNANIGTVENQLAAAGVRLAAMLNDIFDPERAASQPAESQPEVPATQPVEPTTLPSIVETPEP
jgi:hypothetical protein